MATTYECLVARAGKEKITASVVTDDVLKEVMPIVDKIMSGNRRGNLNALIIYTSRIIKVATKNPKAVYFTEDVLFKISEEMPNTPYISTCSWLGTEMDELVRLLEKHSKNEDVLTQCMVIFCDARLSLLRKEGFKHPLVEMNAKGLSIRFHHPEDKDRSCDKGCQEVFL